MSVNGQLVAVMVLSYAAGCRTNQAAPRLAFTAHVVSGSSRQVLPRLTYSKHWSVSSAGTLKTERPRPAHPPAAERAPHPVVIRQHTSNAVNAWQ